MLPFNRRLKGFARGLRKNPTDAEFKLWQNIREKRIRGYQFYRQKNIGNYIVDFYCPAGKLIIELDGGQHNQPEDREYDAERTAYLNAHGVKVVRFWNNEVLCEMEGVLARLEKLTPPNLPLNQGEEF